MKSLNGQSVTDMEQSPTVETYWVVDVFGQNDKVKRKSRRPPTYHAEEYSNFLRKLLSNGNNNNGSIGAVERLYAPTWTEAKCISSNASEVRTRQPADVSDALRKLRQDLTSAFASFSKEFSGDTCDGVSLLMDLLRAIQMVQTELTDTTKSATPGRGNRRAQVRNASADELEVLLCLQQLCLANGQVPQGRHHGCVRLLEHGAGFYGLALALVSNLTKTRSVALQLLTAVCRLAQGHSRVSEALTTLRLNMGEPVRMKLLTGIINSAASRVESLTESSNGGNGGGASSRSESLESSLRFLVEAVAFLNAFVNSAPDLRHKVVIQWEVEEAALNIHALSKVSDTTRNPLAVQLKQQLSIWAEHQMDISLLLDRLTNVTSTNEALRKDLQSLRSRLSDLEMEKRRFAEFENDMKQRCQELENELATLRCTSSNSNSNGSGSDSCNSSSNNGSSKRSKSDSSEPSESGESCERNNNTCNSGTRNSGATSPSTSSMSVGTGTRPSDNADESVMGFGDGGGQRSRSATMKRSSSTPFVEDEDYTIDDVLEELNNIVNSAESDLTSTDADRDATLVDEAPLEADRRPQPPQPVAPLDRSGRSKSTASRAFRLGDKDFGGETSDFHSTQAGPAAAASVHGDSLIEPMEHRRCQMPRTYFGQFRNVQSDAVVPTVAPPPPPPPSSSDDEVAEGKDDLSNDVVENKIQPDILRTIPSRLFQKSWNVVEACSPLFLQHEGGGVDGGIDSILQNQQAKSASIEDLPRLDQRPTSGDEPVMLSTSRSLMRGATPTDQLSDSDSMSMSPVDRAASLGDLHIGDVFSFQYSDAGRIISGSSTGAGSGRFGASSSSGGYAKKSKRDKSFQLTNFIPAFFKSKPNRSDWVAFQTERALMKDYRQNFQRTPARMVPPPPPSSQPPPLPPTELTLQTAQPPPPPMQPPPSAYNDQFWPVSFQALPYRNIPSHPVNGRLERHRPTQVPSPVGSVNTAGLHSQFGYRGTKLMDHPSGLY